MNKIFYLLVATGIVIIAGMLIIYNLREAENSQMTTLLDAMWWCVATVTTVGYGDVVPVTSLGRIVALVYMFFGIILITTTLSIISQYLLQEKI